MQEVEKMTDVPKVRSDGFEKVNYDWDDFPVLLRKNTFETNFRPSLAQSHWHHDVELIAVIKGSILYNVNGEIIRMCEGEGIFVNAQQFHYILSDDGAYSQFYCAVLHPMLLCSSSRVEQLYVAPVLSNENLPYIHLSDGIPWQAELLQSIKQIYEISRSGIAEMRIQQEFLKLWEILYDNMGGKNETVSLQHPHLSSLKNMITYIHSYYQEKITLTDICKAGNVGKTSCTSIFKKYMDCTPIGFLTEVRLQKAAELLRETDMTITEIAYESGFTGASYFAEIFRSHFGCSPREYRE